MVNDATVPGRISYILDHTQPNFYDDLREDILQQSQLNSEFFVMVCNTAHYFYNDLRSLTSIPLLHMPCIAVDYLHQQYPEEKRIGCEVVYGDDSIQPKVNELIYTDIKENNKVDADLYHEIL
ncbi:hypothetical protein FC84_GL000014 [Lapidilactobacillus dextrinicus DSM 20335]|uniref:Aspartate racemase n=1 Tax=Lapidilactobacillus dextrinicus DSM 20335 TaxID=1423738 RepID=A0A0R2BH07_9LACO|nr:hypothetical protein FC84_GL000014 [Lapidilactobacillus dextrinicus DSM 20335]